MMRRMFPLNPFRFRVENGPKGPRVEAGSPVGAPRQEDVFRLVREHGGGEKGGFWKYIKVVSNGVCA